MTKYESTLMACLWGSYIAGLTASVLKYALEFALARRWGR